MPVLARTYTQRPPVSHHLLSTMLKPLLNFHMDNIHTVNLPYALQVLAVPNLSIAMTHSGATSTVPVSLLPICISLYEK